MNLKEKRVLVMGTGRSGAAAAKLLKEKGCPIRIYDEDRELNVGAFYERHRELSDVPLILGMLSEEEERQTDILVLSPGVPTDLPVVSRLRDRGALIWGEVELAYVCSKGAALAITGTNGKTTTTMLLGEIMKRCFSDVKVVGNIGIPYTSVALETTEDTVTVAEISSFQLETVHTFAPKVTAILNITPDHLNRHHTMEEYIAAKERITANQTAEDLCVLNYEDDRLRAFGESLQTRVAWFSSKRKLTDGLYLEDGVIYAASEGTAERLVATRELNLLGNHNYENVMAAAAMALGFGAPIEKVQEALREFEAVEHRIEFVAEKNGVRFYNDSKATNPDAAIQGIRAMQWPTHLIGGGYDKDSSYEGWIDAFDGKVKELVLIGATKEKIRKAAMERGFTAVVLADSLEEAVEICSKNAVPGEAALLSPACASWGMFKDYEERGRRFKEIVRGIKE